MVKVTVNYVISCGFDVDDLEMRMRWTWKLNLCQVSVYQSVTGGPLKKFIIKLDNIKGLLWNNWLVQ